MKSGPENAVKRKIIKILDDHKIFHWCAAASAYGVKGVSDRLAILPNGKLLAIEAKAPGKKATPLQLHFGKKVEENNGYFMVISGEESLLDLELFLATKDYLGEE
jgi:hypothetical protein